MSCAIIAKAQLKQQLQELQYTYLHVWTTFTKLKSARNSNKLKYVTSKYKYSWHISSQKYKFNVVWGQSSSSIANYITSLTK